MICINSVSGGGRSTVPDGFTERITEAAVKKIDIDRWNRKDIYNFFSSGMNPYYSVTVNVDVTDVYDYAKREGLSVYGTMIWAVSGAANSVENFRYKVVDGELWLVDRREPSFTIMPAGEETFRYLMVERGNDPHDFCRRMREKSEAQKLFINLEDEKGDLIFISSVPWVEITAICGMRERDVNGRYDDMTPHISWGRFVERDGRRYVNMVLEVNHRAVDGIHIGRFAKEFERIASELKTI